MSKMNQAVKTKWVAALRSGEYKQGKDYLRTHQGFCCLGVLCDLYAIEVGGGWGHEVQDDHSRYLTFVVNEAARSDTGLPVPVQNWAGLPHSVDLVVGGIKNHITNHNDGTVPELPRGATFLEIADAIESQL